MSLTQFQPGSGLGWSSLSSTLSRREGGTPCHIGIQEVATYIYSLSYTTHLAPGSTSSWSITAVNVLGEPVKMCIGKSSPLRCLTYSELRHHLCPAAKIAVVLSWGCSFTAATPLQLAYLEEETGMTDYWVGPHRGRVSALATAPFWSLARLVHAPGGGRLCHRLVLGCGACSGVA